MIICDKSWTTHIPMLIKTVNDTRGPVLEIGSGFFSTPLLHWICKYHNQEIITLEHNPEYYEPYHIENVSKLYKELK